MTSLTTTSEETWVSDFGPVPFDSLDLTNQQYEVRSYWLADFKLKAITELLAFAARFESPEVFSAYLDVNGDEGYVTFEIKGNTRPTTIALRYMADRWSAVDGRGAHTISKNGSSETAVKSRGEITIFHAFLDAMLIEKVCNQLEISTESQATLFTRINFKEKTFSLVASEDALNDFPALKPYKTSIIPKSPNKTGEAMNAQEEKADATSAQTASVEPSTEPTTSDSSITDTDEAAKIDLARAEVVAWAASAEAPQENTKVETASAVETKDSGETSPVEGAPEQAVQHAESQVITADPVQADVPVEAVDQVDAEVPVQADVSLEAASQQGVLAEVATPVEATPEQASVSAEATTTTEAAPEQASVSTEATTTAEAAPEQASVSTEATTTTEAAPEQASVSTEAATSVESSAPEANVPVETPAPVETPSPTQAKVPVEAKEKNNAEFFTPQKNAAKSSEAGVLGKLAVKNNDEKSNRDQSGRDNSGRNNAGRDNSGRDTSGRDNSGRDNSGRDNSGRDKSGREGSGRDNSGRETTARDNSGRDNSARTTNSNSAQSRTNFAPQSNRSIEAPRPIDSTPKYHTYSQSEVDSLIKKSAENVAASVASKINKQTKTVEDTLKNQDFAFKQALEQINKQSETANQKLDKAVAELTSASTKQKDEFKDALTKEIEEFKSQMNKKVNQGIKVIDTKLEQVAEVKIPKPKQAAVQTQTPKAAAQTGGLTSDAKLTIVAAGVVLVAVVNCIILFGFYDRLTTLENAAKSATTSTSTSSEVPIPDLMKDQINKNETAPKPVQP